MSKGIQWAVLIAIGGLVGLFLGEMLATLLPHGFLHDLFAKALDFGIDPPGGLNLRFFSLTFGFKLHLNMLALAGVAVAVYLGKRL